MSNHNKHSAPSASERAVYGPECFGGSDYPDDLPSPSVRPILPTRGSGVGPVSPQKTLPHAWFEGAQNVAISIRNLPPRERLQWLRALAEALLAAEQTDEVVRITLERHREATGLGLEELKRTETP